MQRFCEFVIGAPVSKIIKPADIAVQGSIPACGENLCKSKQVYTAHSLSLSRNHRPDMPEILLKGRNIVSHQSQINGNSISLIKQAHVGSFSLISINIACCVLSFKKIESSR